ncbi:hypothetical protein [Corynebacterium variabile]|uniref:hypothetical protein n=1 Tax=Corynebacterium variabile TaxID=1727 RepID=UPI003BB0A8D5
MSTTDKTKIPAHLFPEDALTRLDAWHEDCTTVADAEEQGRATADQHAALDDEARELVSMLEDCIDRAPKLIDGEYAEGNVRLTVEETTRTTSLYLHPERLPEGYDRDEDADEIVYNAIGDAVSWGAGVTEVFDRYTEGLH